MPRLQTFPAITLTQRAIFRQVRKTPQGTYLLGYRSLAATIEVDESRNVLRQFPGGRLAAIRLPNGNTLFSRSDNKPKVMEVDAESNEVWRLGANALPGFQIYNVAGL